MVTQRTTRSQARKKSEGAKEVVEDDEEEAVSTESSGDAENESCEEVEAGRPSEENDGSSQQGGPTSTSENRLPSPPSVPSRTRPRRDRKQVIPHGQMVNSEWVEAVDAAASVSPPRDRRETRSKRSRNPTPDPLVERSGGDRKRQRLTRQNEDEQKRAGSDDEDKRPPLHPNASSQPSASPRPPNSNLPAGSPSIRVRITRSRSGPPGSKKKKLQCKDVIQSPGNPGGPSPSPPIPAELGGIAPNGHKPARRKRLPFPDAVPPRHTGTAAAPRQRRPSTSRRRDPANLTTGSSDGGRPVGALSPGPTAQAVAAAGLLSDPNTVQDNSGDSDYDIGNDLNKRRRRKRIRREGQASDNEEEGSDGRRTTRHTRTPRALNRDKTGSQEDKDDQSGSQQPPPRQGGEDDELGSNDEEEDEEAEINPVTGRPMRASRRLRNRPKPSYALNETRIDYSQWPTGFGSAGGRNKQRLAKDAGLTQVLQKDNDDEWEGGHESSADNDDDSDFGGTARRRSSRHRSGRKRRRGGGSSWAKRKKQKTGRRRSSRLGGFVIDDEDESDSDDDDSGNSSPGLRRSTRVKRVPERLPTPKWLVKKNNDQLTSPLTRTPTEVERRHQRLVNNRRNKKKKKKRRRASGRDARNPKPMMFNQSSGSSGTESTDEMMERKRRERLDRDRGRIQPVNLGLFDDQMAAGSKKKKNQNADISPMQIDLNVNWESIGGLTGHVQKLKEMVVLPMLYPKEFERFKMNPPKGVIFHGPPGTGKTLVARVLAAQCSRPGKKVAFYMRKGADCLSKWVGEAERQLRLLFDEAHKTQPSIIFFDEIDGLAPVRSSRQDQIHSSIVSTLLALMDGLDGRGQVIVIGATNRIDAIDPALRRPGRFDRELCFTLPSRAARRHILQIKTKSWQPPVAPEMLDELAEKCVGYCGADLEALCREAFMCSVRRTFPQIYTSEVKLQIDPNLLVVLNEDFDTAVLDLVPAAQRSAVVYAKALPKALAPLLDSQLKALGTVQRSLFPLSCATKAERMNLEDAKASTAKRPEGDDQKAADEEKNAEAKPSEFEKCLVKPCRPRLLICSPGGRGCGAQDLGVAVLHLLEEYPTYSLDLSTVLGDASTRNPEEFCLRMFKEARKNAPSVIYWPRVDVWWDAASHQLRLVLASLLDDVPEDCPVLLLATTECSFEELEEGPLRDEVFLAPDASRHFQVSVSPKLDEQRVFWRTVRPMCLEPPKRRKGVVVPEPLPPAEPAAPSGPASPSAGGGTGKPTAQNAGKTRLARDKEEREMAMKLDFNRVRCFVRTCCSRLNRHYKDFLDPVEEEHILTTDIGLLDIRERNNDRECPTVDMFLKDIDRLVSSVRKTHNSQSIEAREYLNEACHLQDQALSLACQADRDLCYRVRQHKTAIREERHLRGEKGPDSSDEEEEEAREQENEDGDEQQNEGEKQEAGVEKMDEDEEDEKGPPVPNAPAVPADEDAEPAEEAQGAVEEKRPTTEEEVVPAEEAVKEEDAESAKLPSPPVIPKRDPVVAPDESPIKPAAESKPAEAEEEGAKQMDMDDNPPPATAPAPPPVKEPSPSPPREVVLDRTRLDALLERCAQAGTKRAATVGELSAAMTRVQTALHHCSAGVERSGVLDALEREAKRFERPRRQPRAALAPK